MSSGHRVSRGVAAIACALGLLCGASRANEIDPATLALLRDLKPLTDDLARYRYLAAAAHKLPEDQRLVARQLLATTESELGLYTQALRDFPIDTRKNYNDPLPAPGAWQAVDAAAAIAHMAEGRKLVLINEAHHDPHTRALTLALLPRMRAAGFNYFAVEALGDEDADLARRGYPLLTSGSEYLHEPLYGELVRRALQLGFVVVPYEADTSSTAARESGQAKNLYKRVFAEHPDARLFVHAGYAHIDKAKGRLGKAAPMAAELARLSGIEPLSIEQTQFREANPRVPHAAYDQLIASYKPSGPVVLERRADAAPAAGTAPASPYWSANPDLHDISVILPPDSHTAKEATATATYAQVGDLLLPYLAGVDEGQRPDWLGLGGERLPFEIGSELCDKTYPCLVEAFHAKENDQAVPADRFAFLHSGVRSALYLFPGDYRVRVRDADGKVLGERTVTVGK